MRNYNEQEKILVLKMIELGINISSKGFNYILDAVQIIHNSTDDIKITDLYSNVAIIHNAKHTNVERCIRAEVERIYDTNSNIPSVLIADPNNGKLTNREFLYRLAYWLYK